MGLHLPGSAFVNPNTPLRDALVAAAPKRAIEIRDWANDYTPIGEVVDEKSMVNALAGLLATGGSTNHTLHLIAMAPRRRHPAHLGGFRRPLRRHAADRPGLSERPRGRERFPRGRRHGLRDPPAARRRPAARGRADRGRAGGLRRYQTEPFLDGGKLVWREGPADIAEPDILRAGRRSVPAPTAASPAHRHARPGGDEDLGGEARAHGRRGAGDRVRGPGRRCRTPSSAASSNRDFVAVVRFQGPKANGMPELHKLTPPLGVLLDKGFKVALVTDGRMSGASGKSAGGDPCHARGGGRRRRSPRSATAT